MTVYRKATVTVPAIQLLASTGWLRYGADRAIVDLRWS